MQRFFHVLAALCVISCGPLLVARTDRFGRRPGSSEARNVTIIRDDWGIPHVYGKTDADAVFGVMYAQAEDDFNRVETNFINSMGRLAEAEGEKEIYRDLRMKLFIDPDRHEGEVREEPGVAEIADGRLGRRTELLPPQASAA